MNYTGKNWEGSMVRVPASQRRTVGEINQRDRQIESERDRVTNSQRERETEWERYRQRHRERQTERQSEKDTDRQRVRETDRERLRQTDRLLFDYSVERHKTANWKISVFTFLTTQWRGTKRPTEKYLCLTFWLLSGEAQTNGQLKNLSV